MVFDGPNNGRPSKNKAPASTGNEKRGPKIFFATIGVPFANVNSANNCSMRKKCILAGYLSPRRCATPSRPPVRRRSMKAVLRSGFAAGLQEIGQFLVQALFQVKIVIRPSRLVLAFTGWSSRQSMGAPHV
jgi:hypothetical protein